jgi:acyl-CoA dehydrogenase
MIKVLVPDIHTRICDRAIQIYGAMGLTPDTPQADHYAWGRCLKIADGPDEVHLQSIGKMEIATRRETLGAAAAYLTPPARL